MPVLKRLAAFVLAIGAMGALLAPATPAAEQGSDQGTPPPGTLTTKPQQPSGAPAEPSVVAKDNDVVVSTTPDAPRDPRSSRAVARAAASTSVTISDFKFAPKSITVNVGDTVTWTNKGPAAHTATAKDGSFDTGLLQKGESGSATFDKAGTFAYICTPHPFMKGMVKVVAKGSSGTSGGASSGAGSSSNDSASGGGGSSSGAAGASGATGATGATGGSGATSGGKERLADTGTNTLLVVATGLGLLLCGLGLRLLPRRA